MSVAKEIKRDPLGAALVTLAAIIPVLLLASLGEQWQQPRPAPSPKTATKQSERPPPEWLLRAKFGDVFRPSTVKVSYWGNPDARYSTSSPSQFRGIVTHFTSNKPALNFVKYGHSFDERRGGSFGYHFYIAKNGRVYQGAPMSRRTNHIKPPGHKKRRAARPKWSNSNTIGVSLVGACAVHAGMPAWRCMEYATKPQIRSGLALIRALQKRFGLPCNAIQGHGEMQSDRGSTEGQTLATLVRRGC